jgi:FixH
MTIRFNWGTGIGLSYAAFALATIGFVVFAMGRPVVLVRADYYAESLRQDQRMQAVRNARDLGPGVSVTLTSGRDVLVSLPRDQARIAHGIVTLYRASDAAADRVLDLALDADGRQHVSLTGLAAGRWVVQLLWTAGGREYYFEEPVMAR